MLTRSTEIVVSDLEDFDRLLQTRRSNTPGACDFARIQNLRVIVDLSSKSLKAVQNHAVPTARQDSQVAELSVTDAAQVATWFRVSSILLPLKSLRKLRISMDCNEPTPWANVNERAILDPVAPLAATANFDFCLELPRHCDDNIDMPPFKIQRRQRQQYFGYIDRSGHSQVVKKLDFPMLEAGYPTLEMLTAAELEECERDMWREGIDIEREILHYGWSGYTGNP